NAVQVPDTEGRAHAEPLCARRSSTRLTPQSLASARAALARLRFQELPFHDFKHCLEGRTADTKTEASDRTIGNPETLLRTLTAHKETSDFKDAEDFVFCQADGKPLDPDSLRRIGIYPALEKAGVPFQKRASGCHAFRRFVASVIHKQTGSLKLAQ